MHRRSGKRIVRILNFYFFSCNPVAGNVVYRIEGRNGIRHIRKKARDDTMKKTVSILAAALLLLTGCADSSSVTTADLTDSAALAESTGSEAADTTAAATGSEDTVTAADPADGTAASVQQTEAVPGTSAENGQTGTQTVTTAVNGGQSSESVTTSPKTQTKQLIRDLSALSVKGNLCTVTDGRNGRAVVGCSNDGGGMTAYVIDTAADRLVTSFKLKYNCEEFLGVSKQNELITQRDFGQYDTFEGTELVYYDLTTGKAQAVNYKTSIYAFAQYEKKTDTVYGYSRDTLYTFSRDGSFRTAANSSYSDVGFCCFADGIIFDKEYGAAGNTIHARQSGKTKDIWSIEESQTYPVELTVSGSAMLITKTAYVEAKGCSVTNAVISDLHSGSLRAECKLTEGAYSLFTAQDSDTALIAAVDSDSWNTKSLTLFDTKTCKRAKNEISLKANTFAVQCCMLKDSGLWAAAVSESSGSSARTRMFLIDPTQADITCSFDKLYDFSMASVSTKALGKELEPLHEITERILKNTGVHVLIGNEIFTDGYPNNFILTSCEEEGYGVNAYRDKLLAIEKELNRYPKDFFRKYVCTSRSGAAMNGLRVFVPIDITNKQGGGIAAGGITWQSEGWYNVAVRIDMIGGNNTPLHHELWHSADYVLQDAGIDIYDAKWNAHNPNGFTYTANYEEYFKHTEYAKQNLKDAAFKGAIDADEISFVRDYGIVSGMEDSAILIEAMFDTPWHFGSGDTCLGYKYKNTREMIAAFPHLQGKLDLLAAAAKKLWGYAYWEQMSL